MSRGRALAYAACEGWREKKLVDGSYCHDEKVWPVWFVFTLG